MAADDYVLVQGMRATRGALERWQERPWPIVGRWLVISLAISLTLLLAVLTIASIVSPDATPLFVPGLWGSADLGDLGYILAGNFLVLALHALACVAGFMAGSSMRLEADRRNGFSKALHEKAGTVAIAWVALVTAFSLATQAYVLGSIGADLSSQFEITAAELMLSVLPHALPELIALFLPLAAWLIASRRDEWDELLAATFVTVAIAVPVLVATAFVEVTVWPRILEALSPAV